MDPDLRRPVLSLILMATALHVVAIAAFYGLSIESRPPAWRYSFGALWIGLTMYLVLGKLATVRAIRIRKRRGR